MPRKAILTKDVIVAAAMKIARKNGLEAVTARALAHALGCSLSPLFTVFDNMDSIKEEVRKEARARFLRDAEDSLKEGDPFKEYGIRMIRFAKQDPALFSVAFLQPRMNKDHVDFVFKQSLEYTRNKYFLNDEQSSRLIQMMWVFVCGLALLFSSGAEPMDDGQVDRILTMQLQCVLNSFKEE